MKRFSNALSALLAVIATIGFLWTHNRAIVPKEATWENVETEARRGGYQLIGTEDLGERHKKDLQNLLLVDTRQEWEYRTGHIKGALNFPLEPTWFSQWSKKGELERLLGPDENRFIVFY